MGFLDRFKDEDPIQKREAHYQDYFGAMDGTVWHSTDVKDVHIDVYQFPPHDKRPFWTLVTGGMSDEAQQVPKDFAFHSRTEILMYVTEVKPWMISVLKGLAEMPFEDKTFLHVFHTVPNGQPMTAEPSELTSFILFPPYFEEKELGKLKIHGERVDFLWLFPITEKERAYAVNNGSEALAILLGEKKISPVVDEQRQSIV